MFLKNTVIEYPLLLLKSIGRRSFAALGRAISRCSRTVRKVFCSREVYINHMWEQAKINFKKSKKLIVQIDATLLYKMYSQWMEGSGRFYDTKLKISYTAYKMIVVTMSNGSITLPLEGDFLFEKKLSSEPVPTAFDFIQRVILEVKKQFSNKRIVFVLDGDCATEKYLSWCLENGIQTEVRMPSNRVGKRTAIRDIKALRPKGYQIGRTKN